MLLHSVGAYVRRHHVALLALVVALGGTSYAAVRGIPDAKGVFHGCVAKKGGKLRIVKSASRCKSGEFAISFSQKGPAGERGAPGANGDPGAKGDQGPEGPGTGPAGGDLAGNYPNPTIAPGHVTADKLAPAEGWKSLEEATSSASVPADNHYGCLNPDFQFPGCDPAATWSGDVQYHRDPYGIVHLRGNVVLPSSWIPQWSSATSPMFRLPVPYRPDHQVEFVALITSNGGASATSHVRIQQDGLVYPVHSGEFQAQRRWFFDSVTFRG